MPMGTLMRKMARQPMASTSSPPSSGAIAGAMTAGSPIAVMARVAWSFPALVTMRVCITATEKPAANPCRMRKAMSKSICVDIAHRIEATVKTARAVIQRFLAPKRRVAQPLSGMAMVEANP